MKLLMLILIQLQAATIKVAIIDTGFDFKTKLSNNSLFKPKLCKGEHYDMTGMGIQDVHSHGTHITGLIAKNNNDVDYCIYVIKNYHNGSLLENTVSNTINAFKKAIELNVNIINYSGGGEERFKEECLIVKHALDCGITIVTVAGNEDSDLSVKPYYPAMCDPRVIKVMSTYPNGRKTISSNWSSRPMVNLVKRVGHMQVSIIPGGLGYMSGTSQAAAVYTNELLYNYKHTVSYDRYYDKWNIK